MRYMRTLLTWHVKNPTNSDSWIYLCDFLCMSSVHSITALSWLKHTALGTSIARKASGIIYKGREARRYFCQSSVALTPAPHQWLSDQRFVCRSRRDAGPAGAEQSDGCARLELSRIWCDWGYDDSGAAHASDDRPRCDTDCLSLASTSAAWCVDFGHWRPSNDSIATLLSACPGATYPGLASPLPHYGVPFPSCQHLPHWSHWTRWDQYWMSRRTCWMLCLNAAGRCDVKWITQLLSLTLTSRKVSFVFHLQLILQLCRFIGYILWIYIGELFWQPWKTIQVSYVWWEWIVWYGEWDRERKRESNHEIERVGEAMDR